MHGFRSTTRWRDRLVRCGVDTRAVRADRHRGRGVQRGAVDAKPPLPVSEMQPAVPAFCVNAPATRDGLQPILQGTRRGIPRSARPASPAWPRACRTRLRRNQPVGTSAPSRHDQQSPPTRIGRCWHVCGMHRGWFIAVPLEHGLRDSQGPWRTRPGARLVSVLPHRIYADARALTGLPSAIPRRQRRSQGRQRASCRSAGRCRLRSDGLPSAFHLADT